MKTNYMRIILKNYLIILVSSISFASCVQDKLDFSSKVSLDTEIGGTSLTIPLGDGKPTYLSSVVDFDKLRIMKENIQDQIDQAELHGQTLDISTIEYQIPFISESVEVPNDNFDQIISVDWTITSDFINTVPSGSFISVNALDKDGNSINSGKIKISVTPNHINPGNGVDHPVTTPIVITLVATEGALKSLINLEFSAQLEITNVAQALKLEDDQYIQFTKLVIHNNKPMSFDFN